MIVPVLRGIGVGGRDNNCGEVLRVYLEGEGCYDFAEKVRGGFLNKVIAVEFFGYDHRYDYDTSYPELNSYFLPDVLLRRPRYL